MTRDQIKVGQFYTSTNIPGLVLLGSGKRVLGSGYSNDESLSTDKNLVIIKHPSNIIGQVIQNPENCAEGYQDTFVEMSPDEADVELFKAIMS